MKNLIDQLEPQIKKASIELRMEIANNARYYAHQPNSSYGVMWDGQTFWSDDTCDLVNQVIAWLKKSKKERAEIIKNS